MVITDQQVKEHEDKAIGLQVVVSGSPFEKRKEEAVEEAPGHQEAIQHYMLREIVLKPAKQGDS